MMQASEHPMARVPVSVPVSVQSLEQPLRKRHRSPEIITIEDEDEERSAKSSAEPTSDDDLPVYEDGTMSSSSDSEDTDDTHVATLASMRLNTLAPVEAPKRAVTAAPSSSLSALVTRRTPVTTPHILKTAVKRTRGSKSWILKCPCGREVYVTDKGDNKVLQGHRNECSMTFHRSNVTDDDLHLKWFQNDSGKKERVELWGSYHVALEGADTDM